MSALVSAAKTLALHFCIGGLLHASAQLDEQRIWLFSMIVDLRLLTAMGRYAISIVFSLRCPPHQIIWPQKFRRSESFPSRRDDRHKEYLVTDFRVPLSATRLPKCDDGLPALAISMLLACVAKLVGNAPSDRLRRTGRSHLPKTFSECMPRVTVDCKNFLTHSTNLYRAIF